MRRREFIALSGAAVTWPLAASAQHTEMRVVGFLHTGSAQPYGIYAAAFVQGLGEAGFVEGRNVAIEYRWAENQIDRLPELVAELVHRGVEVIATAGGPLSVRAAMAATTTIPIVFSLGSDPVELGLVASLSRPGANVTGVTFLSDDFEAKQLQLLVELVPTAELIGYLVTTSNPFAEEKINKALATARAVGRRIHGVYARTERDLDIAFAELRQKRADALLIGADPTFTGLREQLASLALQYTVPAVYQFREFVVAGGLMSYGVDLTRRSAVRLPPWPLHSATLRTLPSATTGLPRLPEPPFRRAVPTTPADQASARVDYFLARAAFPKWQEGLHPHCHVWTAPLRQVLSWHGDDCGRVPMPTAELCRTDRERGLVVALLQRVVRTSPGYHSA